MKSSYLYKVLRPFLILYFKIRFKPKIIYLDDIPKDGAILIANHSNNFDFLSVGITTKEVVYFMAKDTLFKGILKPILERSGVISVNRRIKDKNPIIIGRKVLNENKILGIFPEGTFNRTNNVLAPFKIGAVKLSYETKKPIVPIAIIGKYKRNKLKIIIGKKYYVSSSDLDNENEIIRKKIEDMINNKDV